MIKRLVKLMKEKPATPKDRDLRKFTTDLPTKTPKGNVTVFDIPNHNTVETFDVPAGFRLEGFLMERYPHENIHLKRLVCGTFQVRIGTKYVYTLNYDA